MSNIVKLKRSIVFNKTPLPSQLDYGELCLNFNSSNPFLSFKDSENEIQKFLSENKVRNLIADVKNDVDASFYTKAQINQMFEDLESGGTITFDDYYKKNEVDTLLQSKSDIGHTHSYTALTDLPDLSIYLTEHQSLENYYTKSEADGKFLTSHQDLSGYAQKSDLDDYLTIASASTIYATKEDLEEFTPTVDAYSKEETDALLAGKANSAHTHDYETLTNKPDLSNFATKGEIPDTNGFATKQELEDYQMKSGMTSYLTIAQAEQDLQPKGDYALQSQIPDVSNFITSGFCEDRYQPKGIYVVPSDLNDYALKSEIPSIEGLATEAELENYMSLSGMSGYSEVNHTHDYSQIQNTPDLSGYASLSDVPKIWKGTLSEYTNLTEIDNDTLYVITDESEQFVTSGDVESMISGYTTLSEVEVLLGGFSPTGHTHVMSDITDLDIPSLDGYATEAWVGANYQPVSAMTDYALKSEVPDSYTKTETDNLLAGKANSAHTHSYNDLEDKPTIPSIEGLATEAELANYQPVSAMTGYSPTGHTHSYNDLEDKPTIPSIEGLASMTDLANYQPVSGMSEYSTTAHTHSNYAEKSELANYQPVSGMSDYALASQIPSIEGLATEAELANYQPVSAMTNYSQTGHTHSQYLTQTSADSRYARVVSCTQAEYDALVQNDQVEQGVLYCITESN